MGKNLLPVFSKFGNFFCDVIFSSQLPKLANIAKIAKIVAKLAKFWFWSLLTLLVIGIVLMFWLFLVPKFPEFKNHFRFLNFSGKLLLAVGDIWGEWRKFSFLEIIMGSPKSEIIGKKMYFFLLTWCIFMVHWFDSISCKLNT